MVVEISRMRGRWAGCRQEGEVKLWGMHTLVVNVQIRAFRPTPNLELIWSWAMMVVTVVGGQKNFRLVLHIVVRRMLHFALSWVTILLNRGYFAQFRS